MADPRLAIDMVPWWADATDARSLMAQALVLMWIEIRWRRPALEGEAEAFDEVHRLLSRAYRLDPDLSYPWTAWAEAVTLRGIDDPMARQAIARAEARRRARGPPIGYRRLPVPDPPRGLGPGRHPRLVR